jgi:hypothetical protein
MKQYGTCGYCGKETDRHTHSVFIVTHPTFDLRRYQGCVWCIDEIKRKYDDNEHEIADWRNENVEIGKD